MNTPKNGSQRYQLTFHDKAFLTCIRHPASEQPREGIIAFIDWGSADRATPYQVGIFRDGAWHTKSGKEHPTPPTYWTEVEPTRG